MLFTADEARKLKPILAQIKELRKEYISYQRTINAFTIWFFILTTIRSLVVSTVIVSMLNQQPDLTVAWNNGEGVGAFIGFLVVSCLPLIGNLATVIAPIAIIIAAFSTGGGISDNFIPFVLPLVLSYTITYGLVFYSNYLINSLVKFNYPKIYEEIKEILALNTANEKMLYEYSITARNLSYDVDNEPMENNNEPENIITEDRPLDDDEHYDDTF